MKVRRFLFGVAAALCVSASAKAAIIIPTNSGGADTEVREFEITSGGDLDPAVTPTAQRGATNELATRALDEGPEANNSDRSSVMYMKFNISGLPNHVSDPGFWTDKKLYFRGYVRNTNLTTARLRFPTQPAGAPPTHIVNFDIRGLEPGHVYADDPGGSTTRTDRSGNSFNSPNYNYNWAEGIGTGANNLTSGISYVSAPGITPFCMTYGSCETTTFAGDPDAVATNIFQSLGKYDDFNSDARLLGNWQWPLPENIFDGEGRYPIGMPLEYTDANGALKQLVFDAQDAGRSSVTLMLNLAVDTLLDPTSTSSGDGPGPGIYPNNTFLNHNYLFIPKEMTSLSDDPAWDPDGSGPGLATGSPYSCDGLPPGANSANCPGGTVGDNSAGAFSPQLIVRVPEPTSLMLLVLGSLAMAAVRRRA